MTLPEPGDLNWGSPLNDAILAAQADAASAKADASSARATAIEAHSTAQSVKEFVEAPVDEQIAAKVAEVASASQGAVDARVDAKVPPAAEGVAGKVPLATGAEVLTGTETTKAVTPAGVKAAVDPIRDLSDETFAANLSASMAGVTPVDVYVAATGGNDAHNGLTRNAPKATIGAALAGLAGTPARLILMAGGGAHVLAAGITVDVNLHSIVGQHAAVVDASGLAAGAAIGLNADTATTPYTRATRRGVNGFELIGPGKASAVIGIKQEGAGTSQAVAHLTMHDVVVHGFGIGVQHGNHNYLVNHVGWDVWDCGVAVDAPSGLTNAGEGLRYFGGRIFNSDLGVRANNVDGELQFFGTSFDYNAKQFELSGGARVEVHGGHVEAGKTTYTAAPITLTGDGTSFQMRGGWMLCTGVAGAGTNTYVVDNASTGGLALFDGVFMNNLQTATGKFATGSGRTIVTNFATYATNENPRLLSDTANLAADGGFENAAVLDDVFLYSDTAAITSRLTGANLAITTSIDQFRTGAKSLKFAKTYGGGSACVGAIAFPIRRPGAFCASRLYYRKPGAETGTIYISSRFATLRTSGDGVPVVAREQVMGDTTIALTAADTGWVERSDGGLHAPEWATHFLVLVVLDSFVGPGNFYIDDLIVTQM